MNDGTEEEVAPEIVEKISTGIDDIEVPKELLNETAKEATEQEVVDIRAQISKMTIPQKIKLAMFGSSVIRGILIFDANKIIQEFVLKNPRLGLNEVEAFAKNTSISDNVLRLISSAKEWVRYYTVKVNLVFNSKTPPDLGLKWLRHLNSNDLKRLSKSKNVPSLIAVTAKKMVEEQEKKKK